MAIDMNRVAAAALEAVLNDEQPRRRRVSGVRALAAGAAIATAARLGRQQGHHVRRLLTLVELPRKLEEIPDAVRERLAGRGRVNGGEDLAEDEEFDDSEWEEEDDEQAPEEEASADDEDEGWDEGDDDWDEGDDDDQPDAEAEDDWDEDAHDDRPDAEAEEGWDEDSAPEDDTADYDPVESEAPESGAGLEIEQGGQHGANARGLAPDLMDVLGAGRARPPVLESVERRLHPAAHPPEPLEREEREEGTDRSAARRARSSDSGSKRKSKSKSKATAGRG